MELLNNLHWSYYILFICLGIAVFTDVTKQKIYNKLTFPTLILGLTFSTINNGWSGLGNSLLGFLIAFIISFGFYATKGIYGGDVKLISAVGAWVGSSLIIETIIWIILFGGILGIISTIKNRTFIPTMKKVSTFFVAIFTPGMKPQKEIEKTINAYVPYGVPIAIGTVIAILFPDLLFK